MALRSAAVLATLVTLLGLIGAIVLPRSDVGEPEVGTKTPRTVAFASYDATVSGLPTLSAPVDLDAIVTLSGVELLRALSSLDELSLQTFAATHAETLDTIATEPPTPEAVAAWWRETAPAARAALTRTMSEQMGNLQGLPYAVRDAANRRFLQASIAALEAESAASSSRAGSLAIDAQLDMVLQISESLGDSSTVPARSLVALDVEWPGRAAVAVGDLDSADYISYLVPGMFFTVDGQIVDWTEIAEDLDAEQRRVLLSTGPDGLPGGESTLAGATSTITATSSSASISSPTAATSAVVAWLGYQTPNLFEVVGLDRAYSGASRLSDAVNGLRAARAAAEPHITLITHSYGSTTASIALGDGSMLVDSLAIIGSPGVEVTSAAQLGVAGDDVYVGAASGDPVARATVFGASPLGIDFGATVISLAGGVDPISGEARGDTVGHLGYFATGTQSMRSLALIGIGLGSSVESTPRPVTIRAEP